MAELDLEKLSIDPATQQMLKKAKADGVRPFLTGPRP